MPYINHKPREDFQEDTFTLVSTLLWVATGAIQDKDLFALESALIALYDLVHMRLGEEVATKLNALSEQIHGSSANIRDGLYRSRVFDEARVVYRLVTRYLDKEGLLFRIQRNLDRIAVEG